MCYLPTMNIKPLIRLAAWVSLSAAIFVTISPIGWRPHDVSDVNFDRAAAFVVIALLFTVGYPRWASRWGLWFALASPAIELLQLLSVGRHARIEDALIKLVGALCGLGLGYLFNRLRQTLSLSQQPIQAQHISLRD